MLSLYHYQKMKMFTRWKLYFKKQHIILLIYSIICQENEPEEEDAAAVKNRSRAAPAVCHGNQIPPVENVLFRVVDHRLSFLSSIRNIIAEDVGESYVIIAVKGAYL